MSHFQPTRIKTDLFLRLIRAFALDSDWCSALFTSVVIRQTWFWSYEILAVIGGLCSSWFLCGTSTGQSQAWVVLGCAAVDVGL